MSRSELLQRIHRAVGRKSYLTPTRQAPRGQWGVLQQLALLLQSRDFDRELAQALVNSAHTSGRLSKVMQLSALCVIATSPRVQDYRRAYQLASLHEQAALEQGGPHLRSHLAAADRHRGVLAFLLGHNAVALEWFTQALEKERSAENLGNVLCALLRSGDRDAAKSLHEEIRAGFPSEIVVELEQIIACDDDLGALRKGD